MGLSVVENHDKLCVDILSRQPTLMACLHKILPFNLPDWWVVSGCIVQTIWNDRHQLPLDQGITDYDLIYFNPDLTKAAEQDLEQTLQSAFSDLAINLDICNQAHVHLWYPEIYHRPYPKLSTSLESLAYYPSRSTALAVQLSPKGSLCLHAPFGAEDALNLTVRPNPDVNLLDIYQQKYQRWQKIWPHLQSIQEIPRTK